MTGEVIDYNEAFSATGRIRKASEIVTDFTPPDQFPWMEDANCKGAPLSVFFEDTNSVTAPAKKYCDPCEVQQECLIFALLRENPVATRYGFLGGMGPADRDKIYKALKEKNNG